MCTQWVYLKFHKSQNVCVYVLFEKIAYNQFLNINTTH